MAQSLHRAEEKILTALVELEVLARRIDDMLVGGCAHDVQSSIERFNQRREHALECVRNLIIQREAIGFRDSETVARFYPVPAKRR